MTPAEIVAEIGFRDRLHHAAILADELVKESKIVAEHATEPKPFDVEAFARGVWEQHDGFTYRHTFYEQVMDRHCLDAESTGRFIRNAEYKAMRQAIDKVWTDHLAEAHDPYNPENAPALWGSMWSNPRRPEQDTTSTNGASTDV